MLEPRRESQDIAELKAEVSSLKAEIRAATVETAWPRALRFQARCKCRMLHKPRLWENMCDARRFDGGGSG